MMYHERENGNYPATNTENKFVGKVQVARSVSYTFWLICFLLTADRNCVSRIKPYIVSRHMDKATGEPQHFPADKARYCILQL